MQGTDQTTGAPLAGLAHLKQSIRDILTTRLGTRVMRRDYGSELPGLVDRPMNDELRVDVFAATANALARWEPRLRLERVEITATAPGRLTLSLRGLYLPDGEEIFLEGIVVQ